MKSNRKINKHTQTRIHVSGWEGLWWVCAPVSFSFLCCICWSNWNTNSFHSIFRSWQASHQIKWITFCIVIFQLIWLIYFYKHLGCHLLYFYLTCAYTTALILHYFGIHFRYRILLLLLLLKMAVVVSILIVILNWWYETTTRHIFFRASKIERVYLWCELWTLPLIENTLYPHKIEF